MKNKINLLYIHGITVDKNSNKPLEELCIEKDINYYSLDLPWHGECKKEDIELSIFAYANYVKEFILENRINHNLIIFGHSMGGAISMSLTSRYAKELDIKKLILLDPLNSSVLEYTKHLMLHPVTALININSMKSNENAKKNHYIIDWINRISKTIPNHKKIKILKLFLNITSKESLFNLDKQIKKIDVPTEVIFGSEDYIIPYDDSFEHLLNLNQIFKFHLINDSGHAPHEDNPEGFKNLMRDLI